jgi:hypothetical protein
MSSVPSGIAGSVSQAALQQSQAARAADAARNKDEQEAARLRKLLEKHVNEVEDSEQTDPKQLPVNEHNPQDQQGRKRREQGDQVELTSGGDESAEPSTPRAEPPTKDGRLYRHLDIEA